MDCVGCEKCRLWGKLQVLGLGTALKILFSVNDENLMNRPVCHFFVIVVLLIVGEDVYVSFTSKRITLIMHHQVTA